MLDVNIEKILPITAVRDALNKIIDEVEGSDQLYVVTKNGKPAAILVGVHHLEKLTGISHKEIMPDEPSTEADRDIADTTSTSPSPDEISETKIDSSPDNSGQLPTPIDSLRDNKAPSENIAPIESNPLSNQPQATSTDVNEFDDLFSSPNTAPIETAPVTAPPVPMAEEPIIAQPTATQAQEPPATEPVMPQDQPQPAQTPITQPATAPVQSPLDNTQSADSIPPTNQANTAQ